MVPRTEIVWIERTKTVPQGLALALRSGFSRIPVIGENVDDIIGVVYTPYDDAGQWRTELARELKAAGYSIDANNLI